MPKRKATSQTVASEAPPEKKKLSQSILPFGGGSSSKTSSKTYEAKPFTITSAKDKEILCERRGPEDAKPSLIFTHGAGGGLSNAATSEFADGFAEVAPVVSFQGTMNLQSRTRSFHAVLAHEDSKCALGGRSMGARAAVLAAQESSVHPDAAIHALILVSYPMVGAQRGDSREQILLDLPEGIDVLFISGGNDSMCSIDLLRKVMGKMKARAWLVEVQGADHGMSLRQKGGVSPMRKRTGSLAAQWLEERDEEKRYCSMRWSDGKVVVTDWQKLEESEKASEVAPAKKGKK
jgi:predicted alpha/beta-hydrolase family hydrolase